MKFQEKNEFVVKHTSDVNYSQDLELFKEHCPNSRLHTDLKRVNSFNKKKLDGLMLWELLDKVTPADILKNRGVEISPMKEETATTSAEETATTSTEETTTTSAEETATTSAEETATTSTEKIKKKEVSKRSSQQ